MAPYPLGAGQYHPPHTTVLLYRYINARPEARSQSAHTYTNRYTHADAASLANAKALSPNTDGDLAANADPMVPAHTHTDDITGAYGRAIGHPHATADRYADPHTDVHANGHSHADPNADLDPQSHNLTDIDRKPDANVDFDPSPDGYFDSHSHTDSVASDHTNQHHDTANTDRHNDHHTYRRIVAGNSTLRSRRSAWMSSPC